MVAGLPGARSAIICYPSRVGSATLDETSFSYIIALNEKQEGASGGRILMRYLSGSDTQMLYADAPHAQNIIAPIEIFDPSTAPGAR
jgi:hypothetical protein